jgi:hypothetical protein
MPVAGGDRDACARPAVRGRLVVGPRIARGRSDVLANPFTRVDCAPMNREDRPGPGTTATQPAINAMGARVGSTAVPSSAFAGEPGVGKGLEAVDLEVVTGHDVAEVEHLHQSVGLEVAGGQLLGDRWGDSACQHALPGG